MRRWSWKQGMAAIMGLMLSVQAPLGAITPVLHTYAETARAATVNASTLNVRSGPGTTYSQVTKLAKGAAVTVIGETTGSDGKLWYQIQFSGSGGAVTTGYALNTYIRFPVTYNHDSDFESYLTAQGFPDSYKDGLRQLHAQYPNWIFVAQQTGLDWNTVIQNEGVLGRNLVHKNSISSFKSVGDGAYNWDTSSWPGFDGSTWVAASDGILRYYMDPRNFLDEVHIFQFLTHGFDSSIHTREGLQTLLKGSFMEQNTSVGSGSDTGSGNQGGTTTDGSGTGIVGPGASSGSTGSGSSGGPGVVGGSGSSSGASSPAAGQDQVTFGPPQASISKHDAAIVTTGYGPGMVGEEPGSSTTETPSSGTNVNVTGSVSYVDIIMNAASQSGVNPYVIAAMIIQEQGRNGQGKSISGNYSGYAGFYNFFNVGAYQSDGMTAVERGLWYASQSGNYGRPWNSPEKSIIGGALFYGTNYTNAGQDTFYLKKYNVQGSNMYKHQYMTNVDGGAAEASIFAEAYSSSLKNMALKFKIPVYTNMPASPCVKPTGDGSPNNKLKELGTEGFALTPTFNKDTSSYDLIVDHSVSSVNIFGTAIDSTAGISGGGTIQLQSGNNDITLTVKAQNGTERTYVIHVVRQNNGPTYNSGLGGGTSGSGNTTGTGGSVVDPGGGPGATAPSTGQTGTPGGSNVVVISPAG